MLWRRFNEVKDLEEIIKHMDFIGEKRVGSYNHPFYGKRFPISADSFEKYLESTNYISVEDGEYKTQLLSNWVYNNCAYNSKYGNIKTQFNKAKDAYYYYKRREECGY